MSSEPLPQLSSSLVLCPQKKHLQLKKLFLILPVVIRTSLHNLWKQLLVDILLLDILFWQAAQWTDEELISYVPLFHPQIAPFPFLM